MSLVFEVFQKTLEVLVPLPFKIYSSWTILLECGAYIFSLFLLTICYWPYINKKSIPTVRCEIS